MTKKMYVVFKTHFDIGFTDLAKNVMDKYRGEFIPRAVKFAEELPNDFVWTTGSWLIHDYLNHDSVSKEDKQRLEAQLKSGNIRWHAMPATLHCEAGDKTLMEYGISISHDLDKKYGFSTSASKMTDIPGHTIGMVPIMANNGIKYLHIGVNAASSIPELPEMFLWRAQTGEEIVVHYAKDYGATFEREGWDEMLTFAHTHDNQGPPQTAEEITEHMTMLREQYQGVEIIPAGLDAFAEYAWSKKDTLPVVEEEIADTWIHGVGSDSLKIGKLKMLLRLRNKWLEEGRMDKSTDLYKRFSEQLLLVVEHTWGTNANVFLPDYKNYRIEDFEAARKRDKIVLESDRSKMDFSDIMSHISTDPFNEEFAAKRSYKNHEASWNEQREYIEAAIQMLPEDMQVEVTATFEDNNPKIDETKLAKVITVGAQNTFENFNFIVASDGGLSSLVLDGKEFIHEGKRFGGLSFERFDFDDYQIFMKQYSRLTERTAIWALVDFNKRGLEAIEEVEYELIKPYVLSATQEVVDGKLHVKCDLRFQTYECKNWGLPEKNQISYIFDPNTGTVDVSFAWNDKKASRMPEGYWMECSIGVSNPKRWRMNKLGTTITTDDIVRKGNRNLHALDDTGLTYKAADAEVLFSSYHAPLHSIGRRSLLKFDQKQIGIEEGMYVLLQNNTWGTNFRDWFEDDVRFKFSVALKVIK